MRVVVLGSAQDGGSPQVGFADAIGPWRMASSVAVMSEHAVLLMDASPDLRPQQRRLLDRHPYDTMGGNAFDAVLLTHAHMGHYAGLVHFGKEAHASRRLPVVASPRMLEFLAMNEPWASLFADDHLSAAPLSTSDTIRIGDMTVKAIPVPHRAEHTDTMAWSVSADFSVLYVPDIDAWRAWPEALTTITRHDVALVDGTYYNDDELPGRQLADVPHPTMLETMELLSGRSGQTRIVLTHLNRSNPAGDPSSGAANSVRSAGLEVATDGLVIDAYP